MTKFNLNCSRYSSPKVTIIEVAARKVLCQSGNEHMKDEDYGDGGFSEV